MVNDPNTQPTAPAPDDAAIDPMLLQRYLQNVRDNQNLMMGILGGAAGALLGAVIWAIIAAVAHLNIGFIAIAVGFLAGYGVRYLGKGIDVQFAIVGSICAALGVAAGQILAVCIFAAKEYQTSVFTIIGNLDPATMKEMLLIDFSPMDLFFYGIALWAGFKYAKRIITPDEVKSFTGTTLAR